MDSSTFLKRWSASGAAERANYQLFLSELCDVLEVPRPEPSGPERSGNVYVFERSVRFQHPDGTISVGRIDLYKRGCFVLEAKQGVQRKEAEQLELLGPLNPAPRRSARGTSSWDTAMLKAKSQAEQYVRSLPAEEGRPPFILTTDVGHSIHLYSEFTRTGGNYVPFPDTLQSRISLEALTQETTRTLLRTIWTNPESLDPASRSARVTGEIAAKLGLLAQSLETVGHSPERVAAFLMRSLFTMFAEDVGLLPKASFLKLLISVKDNPQTFVPLVEELWTRMNTGGFSTVLREKVLQFNGGLFEEASSLPLDKLQLNLLIEAAKADWKDVEPAIFGTLLERALDPRERHKLGAHYTPRAYVERLVLPTVIEPLREEWRSIQAAALALEWKGKTRQAVAEVQRFHRSLCELRVLDPACGSGNFLYVTLEHLKRLEGEVLLSIEELGHNEASLEMSGFTVDPHQLLGIEVNPRAAAIAELVLWIGYLQWHFRTRGRVLPPEPVIKNFRNIECRDALLAWERTEPFINGSTGESVSRWDGYTTKVDPTTGQAVPDENARVPVLHYIGVKRAEWPKAEFIVGNPPFIGNKRMREHLGDGYVEALRAAYAGEIPKSVDLVMYWWDRAAEALKKGEICRFGLITTNSITQSLNRVILEKHLGDISLLNAIPDHPWVDSADGAAVRIAMTVACLGQAEGRIDTVISESEQIGEGYNVVLSSQIGIVHADLSGGANVASARKLRANQFLSSQGMTPLGIGFRLKPTEAELLLGRQPELANVIRPYAIGRDIVQRHEQKYIIDFFGLSEAETRERYPELYQRAFHTVKPERDAKRENTKDTVAYAKLWWIFAKPRPMLRSALFGLSRYIGTCRTAKHRLFTFVDGSTIPDAKIVAIALEDAYFLGVLSSRLHVTWATRIGAWLGIGNDSNYNHSACFCTFPFPSANDIQKDRIRNLAESLDAHRRQQQRLHPELSLTDMYNVLERLRFKSVLTTKERAIHQDGLLTVLFQLHEELDFAVAAAYGWSPNLPDEDLLARLLGLNAERLEEERIGTVLWLRPEYQSSLPEVTALTQSEIVLESKITVTPTAREPWPAKLAAQAAALRSALTANPSTAKTLVHKFAGSRLPEVEGLLETLVTLGQAQRLQDGRFAGL